MSNQYWNTISEIIPNRLYLTGLNGVKNTKQINDLQINIIVSVMELSPFLIKKPKQYANVECVHFYAEDSEDFEIKQYFEKFIRLVNDNPTKRIVVHCLVGVSRSASLVIAYLISNNKLTVVNAIEYVKEIRNIIDPNIGFLRQLEEFKKSS